MSELKKTPLYEVYQQYGGKTIDFGGWALPVQFSSIKEEHEAVRTKAGLFDVSHMGEVEVKGPNALLYLQKLVTNDVGKIIDGQAQYTAMCDENGGTVDDLLIYRRTSDHFLLVINAANIEKDVQWMNAHAIDDVEITNVSDQIAQLALQGPKAEIVLQTLTDADLSTIQFFHFVDEVDVAGVKTLVSRTGYTGEDGFELYCQREDAKRLWQKILEAGKEAGVMPCGLGARDTLRFEAKLPLYGQELSRDISPLEAGIGFAVKLNKEVDFVGREALKKQKEAGLKRRLVGLEMIEKGIPRTGYEVYSGDKRIGFVTTGTQSPTLKKNVGLAILDIEFTKLETEVDVQIRKKRLKAKVVTIPFYKRQKTN
ncbi:glycine cleavage system aminomethyltransferase GcvT [Halalkalibacterium ligniniphilum]|uniref:glycine cleavage system aminomethyltransferase GcvT n=1 Tax=Halalkalibacterium ligniniphilum TaxID=1134413 RepID=UPI00034913CE|nr:glycine cleavage system aminomethyltransferase GcvT [Halalkalibacterium ligniniphilum]